MENSAKNLNKETQEETSGNMDRETVTIENIETRVNNILKRFKNIINDLKLNENSLSGSFSDVYNNFRSSIIINPDLENYKTLQKRMETDPPLYQIRIKSIENYLDLIEKYPNFLKLEISNKDPDNLGGFHDLFKEAEEERDKIINSGDDSFDRRERVDIYIKKCSDRLNEKGDVNLLI